MTHYNVIVYRGKKRPAIVKAFGVFKTAEAAQEAIDRKGYATVPVEEEWAQVVPRQVTAEAAPRGGRRRRVSDD